jgi:Fasciclin domain
MVNDPSYMYTHMYSFTDYRGPEGKMCVNSGTIYDYLNSNPQCSKFKKIVDRSHMSGQLNEQQANFTIMVATDNYLQHIPNEYFDNMDDGLARQILKASTMIRVVDKKILVSSPVSYYNTLNPEMRMYVTNIGGRTRINNCSSVVQYDLNLYNGTVHIVDNLVVPSDAHFMN